jgi:hypothetical protein
MDYSPKERMDALHGRKWDVEEKPAFLVALLL